jgi:hypothetical protein
MGSVQAQSSCSVTNRSSSRAAGGGSDCGPWIGSQRRCGEYRNWSALDSAKSMMRDVPPKCTAGFARHSVSSSKRLAPPQRVHLP